MNILKTLSRACNFLLLLCFFLPFTPTGCGPSATEMAEKAKADSVFQADSMRMAKIRRSEAAVLVKGDSAVEKKKTADTTTRLGVEALAPDPVTLSSFGKELLDRMMYRGDADTGFGIAVFMLAALPKADLEHWYGILFVLCLCFSFLSTFFLAFYGLSKSAHEGKIMLVISISGLFCFFSYFLITYKDTLYGIWVTLAVWLISLGLIWLLRRQQRVA